MENAWVITGKPPGTVPSEHVLYEIRCSRKGVFKGYLYNIGAVFAEVEVVEGTPKFASYGAQMAYNGRVSIRSSLVHLTEISTECCDNKVYKNGKNS